ncbi:DUF4191 domain-containing protein [Catellatospora sp. KI3]|uniref:DUF4191 domain-containing protein n=1 Tax=Catellatospora sp. KI3 TaxID=3041620 RepID=UPI0024822AF0|nr:DUF4191 domain-containing protein [Catellatospora sp. KI3]MDI1465539.1 DUF4191 domain-containing protein [Catellatospora sp. KI3]
MAKAEEKVSFFQRLKQIGMVFSFTAKQDRWFVPLVAAAALIPLAVTIAAVLLGAGWLWLPIGILFALLAVLIVLNLRSNTAMMNMMEGQPGAAGQLVEQMRGDWRVKQAVSATAQMDVVHLVIGKPGVILLAEGAPQRVKPLLGEQKRRLAKVIGDTPLYDYIIGTEEGQLSIRKLRSTLLRLPVRLKGKDINALDRALTALTARPQMPKGGLPKEFRPKMPRGRMR